MRYSDVRETRSEHVLPVLKALFERVVVGLSPACTQLDDDAAAQMVEAIGQAHGSCLLLDEAALKADWLSALHQLLGSGAAHPRIRGRACRLLLEQRALADGELARRANLALSTSVEPSQAAQWIEGLVAGEKLLLVHQQELLATLDDWLGALADEVFQSQLPLLRRAFSGLSSPERRAVAQRLKQARPAGQPGPASQQAEVQLDQAKVAQVLPVLAHILGVSHV